MLAIRFLGCAYEQKRGWHSYGRHWKGTMRREGQGISWGFAVTSAGILVIRNWYLLFGSLGGVIVCALMFAALASAGEAAALFILVAGLYVLWSFVQELLGVRVGESEITYTVRLGIASGIFPLFRKTILMKHVLHASSLREPYGMRIAYLSGEFGEAKILFDTKGGRDRFFAIVQSRFPHIKIYRWT